MSDQKMRDLMERVTAMSPQPPEFPGEHQKVYQPERRRSGALVFAVAGLAVLALALPLAFWQGERQPVTTVDPGSALNSHVVYLVQHTDGNLNPALVATELVLTHEQMATSGPLASTMLLARLSDGHTEIPAGLFSAVPSRAWPVRFEAGNPMTLDMTEEFLEGAGGLLADFTMLNQIIYTVTHRNPNNQVLFTVNGEPIEAFGTEGLSLVDPVGRDTFLEHLNPIIITQPVSIDEDGQLTVRGRTNVFEANVSYRIEGVTEGYTTATCGTGCWGDFEIVAGLAGVDLTGKYLEVYSVSAMDGSVTHLVRLPLPTRTPG